MAHERRIHVSSPAYSVDEIEVSLTIKDGKVTVESRSGAKGGSIGLNVSDERATITLDGAGSDYGTAQLTGPELSNFRTIVDAGLSSLSVDRSTLEHDRRVLYTGYESLGRYDEGVVTTLDVEALRELGIVDDSGAIAGGSRQVRCTVLNSGTAILNLVSDSEFEFNF